MDQMRTAVGGPPTHIVSSFIPIHFNYPMSRLAQSGNLQLILPHLKPSNGGGLETSSNGMKCHSVVAFVTKMLGRSDGEWLERSVYKVRGCVCESPVVLFKRMDNQKTCACPLDQGSSTAGALILIKASSPFSLKTSWKLILSVCASWG